MMNKNQVPTLSDSNKSLIKSIRRMLTKDKIQQKSSIFVSLSFVSFHSIFASRMFCNSILNIYIFLKHLKILYNSLKYIMTEIPWYISLWIQNFLSSVFVEICDLLFDRIGSPNLYVFLMGDNMPQFLKLQLDFPNIFQKAPYLTSTLWGRSQREEDPKKK